MKQFPSVNSIYNYIRSIVLAIYVRHKFHVFILNLDMDIDGIAADFAMRLKEVTQAALDRTTREVKRLSELAPKMNYQQTCFESVALSVRVGGSEESSNDTTGHDAGWCFWSALLSRCIDGYFGLNVRHIYPVLSCLLYVK